MTNVAVEFFEAAAPPGPTPTPSRAWRTRVPLIAAGYWVLAAGLAAWAPFTRLYAVTYSAGFAGGQYIDGWGRMRVSGPDSGGTLGHAPRYGIALVAAAALLLLTAGVQLLVTVPRLRRTRAARVARAVGGASTAVPGLLAGLLITMAIDIEATLATVNDAATEMSHPLSPGDGAVSLPHAEVGPCVWLVAAALLAAVVAAVLAAVQRSREPASAPESATHAPVDHPVPLDMTDLEGIPGSETLD